MTVIDENSDEVTIKFNKTEFRKIQNFFILNEPEVIKKMCVSDEFIAIEKLVYLEGVDKGFFKELSDFLNKNDSD